MKDIPTSTAEIPPKPPAMNALIEFAVEEEVDVSMAGVPSTAVSVP
jgi:hypothetical protein